MILSQEQRKSLEARVLRYHEQLKGPEGAEVREYLTTERGLLPETIVRFKLGLVADPDDSDEEALGMISIPFITPTGPVALRFRRPPGKEGGPKYWQPHGTELSIFNTPAFMETEETIWVTEGEVDCITLVQCGIPAVGIPGAGAWKPHYELLFEGYSQVVICADNDDKEMKNGKRAGREFAARVAANVPNPRVALMPEGEDVNSTYCKLGREWLREYLGMGAWKKA